MLETVYYIRFYEPKLKMKKKKTIGKHHTLAAAFLYRLHFFTFQNNTAQVAFNEEKVKSMQSQAAWNQAQK